MAPLSYYWIISFIYIVIAKENNLCHGISCYNFFMRLTGLIRIQEIFPHAILNPDFLYVVPHKSTQKRDMYICFNQVIMNYKGSATGAGHVKRENF